MKRVTGIGGIFFKAKDPEKLKEWYRKHLELPIEDWGGMTFDWNETGNPPRPGQTVWSIFPPDTTYLGAGGAPFMINYRVDNLDEVLAALRAEGCPVESPQEMEYGKFGWVTDPEGNRIELWQPPATPPNEKP